MFTARVRVNRCCARFDANGMGADSCEQCGRKCLLCRYPHLEDGRSLGHLLVHLHERARIGRLFRPGDCARSLRDMGSGRPRCDDELRCAQLFVSRAHGAAGDAKLRRKVLPGRQARAGCDHAPRNRRADTLSDRLSQRPLRRAVEFQLKRLGHGLVVHDFCAFLVLFSDPRKGIYSSGRRRAMKMRTIIGAASAAIALAIAAAASAHDVGDKVTPNFAQAISNIPGKSLIAVVVDYPPGGASVPHTHAKSSFIYAYVISGSIESKVNDGPTRIYRAGERWSEPPGASHPISRNASKTLPAKLLAVFVVDTDDKELTTPVK